MSILEELAKSSQAQVKLRKSCPGKSYKEIAQRALEIADAERLNQKERKFSFPFYAACAQSGLCLLYTSPSPRDRQKSRMPSSA